MFVKKGLLMPSYRFSVQAHRRAAYTLSFAVAHSLADPPAGRVKPIDPNALPALSTVQIRTDLKIDPKLFNTFLLQGCNTTSSVQGGTVVTKYDWEGEIKEVEGYFNDFQKFAYANFDGAADFRCYVPGPNLTAKIVTGPVVYSIYKSADVTVNKPGSGLLGNGKINDTKGIYRMDNAVWKNMDWGQVNISPTVLITGKENRAWTVYVRFTVNGKQSNPVKVHCTYNYQANYKP